MGNSTRILHTILICSNLLLTACSQRLPEWQSGKLVIIVPELGQGAEAEFERDLAKLFAKQLSATLEMIALPQHKISSALHDHQAHLAAASLRSINDIGALQFGPSYQSVRELLVCNRNSRPPAKLADLKGRKFAVVAGSAQEIALQEALESQPALQWQTRHELTSIDLLAEVADGTLDCAVVNKLQLAEAHNYYTNLLFTLDIALPSNLAWGFPRDVDPSLLGEVEKFFERIRQDGTLNRLLERYYGHNNRLGRQDAAAFISGAKTVLPHYRRMFEEAAAITGEDWRLLAALAYQESQWNPLATSFTNVRGMMMLTEDTADRMKVKNRLDARESIIAGAKYLMLLKEQMPARIQEPDRTWLALAAYNKGYGHLEDARILTSRANLNPDSWMDVKKQLPLLNQPGYYQKLKHGYARGGEAVILVESIRNYYDMLKRLEPEPIVIASEATSYRLIEPLQRLLR